MKKFWKYISPYKKYFILGPICMVIEVLCEIQLPYLLSKIINNGCSTGDLNYIIQIGLLMLGTIIIMVCGGIGGAYFASKAAMNFGCSLRKDLFSKVQYFSFANVDQFSSGSLITRMTNDVTQLQNVTMMALRMMLRAPGMLIGAFIMAAIINLRLALIIAVVVPILAIILAGLIKIGFPRFDLMQSKLDQVNTKLQENLTNVRVVKSFVRGTMEEKRFAKSNEELKDASLRALSITIFTMPLMTLAMNITTIAVVWFGGKQVIFGEMQVGDLTAFTTYIVQILMSLMMLAMVLLQSSRAVASAKRIVEVLDTNIDIDDIESKYKEVAIKEGAVEFKRVSFGYGSKKESLVLKDISFRINPGETLGIVGGTGSGKTSLVQLIPRLYDVKSGEVLVDGINVKDYSLYNLREAVGMVLQKNVLFSGTIKENLLWGDANASQEEVEVATNSSQAHEFVTNFTDGYETELGQGGVNVSGGQKQRLCIARALLKKPKILILDDSTSAVDTATEAKIRESFQTDLKEATKIIIAQRISSVEHADQILVLDEGEVVGLGCHEELLNSCPAYQEIYYSQRDKEVTA